MSPDSPKKFYLTTPIYYVNARPHIGHAYTTIVADVLARRHRLLGDDVFFLTGTDEHGQKIERSAAAAGIPPEQFADSVSSEFQKLWDRMGLTYNKFIRTTDPEHAKGVQHLFAELYARGFIYLSTYTGAYCVSDEAFVDVPVGQPCPDCGRLTEQVTEENFFFKLSAFQRPLIDLIETGVLAVEPESRRNEVLSFLRGNVAQATTFTPDTGIRPEAKYGTNSTSPLQQSLSSRPEVEGRSGETPVFAAAGAEGTSPNTGVAAGFSPRETDTHNEGASAPGSPRPTLANSDLGIPYVPGALKDLSISRSSFTWGIPVPQEVQQAAGATQKHVIYVWLDALANYMTAIGYGATTEEAQKQFHHFWPADLHLVGKEIIRFHCVYWPAFLLALNPELQHSPQDAVILSEAKDVGISLEVPQTCVPQLTFEQHRAWADRMLPKAITAHGWLLFDNSKMSKSKGNIVRTETILEAFGTLYPPVQEVSPDSLSSRPERAARSGETPVFAAASAEGTSPNPELTATTRPPIDHERDLFASDVLRYFLLREIPFGQDGSFSFDALVTRYNADLANGYGNLVSRTLKMIHTFCDAEIPSSPDASDLTRLRDRGISREFAYMLGARTPFDQFGARSEDNAAFQEWVGIPRTPTIAAGIALETDRLSFAKALEHVSRLTTEVDGFISNGAPWKLAKLPDAAPSIALILYTAAESIRIITALLYPILPYATARVWAQLGLGDIEAAAANGELKNLEWGGLKPGTKLGPLAPIFPRADKGIAKIMTDMENNSQLETSKLATGSDTPRPEAPLKQAFTPTPANPVATDPTHPAAPPIALDEPSGTLPVAGSSAHTTGPDATPSHTQAPASGPFASAASRAPVTAGPADASPQITIDDFAKVELRVAEIKVCERIPKADKLLRLEVDLGHETRQILSGIAEFYTPEDLLGRRIIVITNLAPRKMRGLDSHGMLLAASAPEEGGKPGKPILATVPAGVPLGSRLK